MASLFKVKALYDFEAKEGDDLGFPAGQIIDVTEEVDDNWLEGRYTDASGSSQQGIFPREFVEKYEPEVPTRPTRPARQKQEVQSATPVPVPASLAEARTEAEDVEVEDPAPRIPATSKPQVPPIDALVPEEVHSPLPHATRAEPPPTLKPAPAEPAVPAGGRKPPPVAAKSNAFRDRIAAFNQPAAAPIVPMVPGGSKPQASYNIRKPFVAPPPSSNSYVAPPKAEPVHKPYIREEDPEIRRRQEEDRAAAEAAGLTGEPSSEQQEEDEDAPKPTSLKERIARLQQQQLEQAQRRAEGGPKKEKKAPIKKASESSEHVVEVEDETENVARARSAETGRHSLDVGRDRPRVPSAQRRPTEPLSSMPSAPEHELVSDGNEADQSAAGETTEDDGGTIGPEDSDERPPPPLPRALEAPEHEPDVGDEEDTTEDAEEEEEDSMDEETRRRMELRERMAKMSGGMGMPGMFGPAGGMPIPGAPPKKRSTKEKKVSEDEAPTSPPPQRISMIPVPGMTRVQSPESDITQIPERDNIAAERDQEDEPSLPPPRRSMTQERGAPPPVPRDSRPQERAALPISGSSMPAPRVPESRPVPPPPPAAPLSPGPGSESDDEASMHRPETSGGETPGPLPIRTAIGGAPPVPPSDKRSSYFGGETLDSDKRASRPPPPIPGSPLASPRPPPPPPPSQAPTRSTTTTLAEADNRMESDYEGDYDTDIASSAKHKDALKAHVREPSLDDSTTADEMSVSSPPNPPPHASAPRAIPPPPPGQSQQKNRPSVDAPRAPPPIPPATSPRAEDDEDYDPYRYDGQQQRSPPPPVPNIISMAAPSGLTREPEIAGESSADDPPQPRPSMDRPPPPPPQDAPQSTRAPTRQSLDVQRSATAGRRSVDQARPSGEHGQIATDLNLSEDTPWWTVAQPLPPVLQARNGIDILSECEESTTSKRGGRTTVSKDIYVLFIDYSQTVITARYDSKEPLDVQLEQKHLPPPPKLRQDQLEAYWQRFGRSITEKAHAVGHSKKDTVVADGSAAGFVADLVKAQGNDVLLPVGTRAYGSLIYANLANASTMQFDEIRPGDVVTLRNTRFEGTHGAMKHKYKQEYGSSHVAIVEEWDGTKRAIRAWEQGRERKDKGVKSEKFRLGDLRSGKVKVWRVVGRDWVEWA